MLGFERPMTILENNFARRRPWAHRAILALLLGVLGAAPASPSETRDDHDRVDAALRRHILQNGPWKAENFELRVLPFGAPPVALGQVRYRVLQPNKFAGAGMHNFRLAVEVDGKELARLWLKAEIRVYEQVVVAAAPLARQETVAVQDLRLERRELAGRGSRPFTRIEDVIGKQTNRTIEANEVVATSAVDRPTLIKRGSAIRLIFESGSLRVETAGVAEEAGKAGELIQVKNTASGKILRGIVLDGRQVRLN